MTVFTIILPGLLRSRRTLAIAGLSLLGLVVAALLAFGDVTSADAAASFGETLLLPVVTALVALVMGASALGEEREDRTILYLAQTPVARLRIVVEGWLAAFAATLVVIAPAAAAGAVLVARAGTGITGVLWSLAAAVLAAAAYTAVATALGLLVRRAVIVGMLYVLLWEGSVASFAASADRLSIASYGRRLLSEGLPSGAAEQVPDVGLAVALVVLAATTAGAILIGARRLQHMELP